VTARLLGTLGIELAFGPDDRGVRAAQRAVDMARRIGDPELMRTPATVLAGGAQHLVALRHALRAQPPER
jgi:hypothetical protein